MVGVDCADGVAVLGEVELDGGQGVTGFEPADLGLADPAQFLERQGAGAGRGFPDRPRAARCVPKRLGREHQIAHGVAGPTWLGKGAPDIW